MSRKKGVLLLLLCLIISITQTTFAETKIDQLKNEQKNLKDQKVQQEEELKKNQQNEKLLKEQIDELEQQVEAFESDIVDIENDIVDKEVEIANMQKALMKAKQEEKDQYEALKKRIKYMYENGNKQYMELLLSSNSLSDFFNNVEYIEAVMKYDNNLMNKMTTTRVNIQETEKELQEEKSKLLALKNWNVTQHNAVKETKDAQVRLMHAVQSDIENQKNQIEELKEDYDQLVKEIKKEEDKLKYAGGKMEWPVPSRYYISSGYGLRKDPISGASSFHKGLDIPAPYGTKVIAAAGGKVIYSGVMGGFGKTIMISHGSGIVTIYAHNSSLVVSKGQTVTRGTTVAKIGSTGRSTGNHLHFEIRVNNNHKNPWNYLGSKSK